METDLPNIFYVAVLEKNRERASALGEKMDFWWREGALAVWGGALKQAAPTPMPEGRVLILALLLRAALLRRAGCDPSAHPPSSGAGGGLGGKGPEESTDLK